MKKNLNIQNLQLLKVTKCMYKVTKQLCKVTENLYKFTKHSYKVIKYSYKITEYSYKVTKPQNLHGSRPRPNTNTESKKPLEHRSMLLGKYWESRKKLF